MYKAWKASAQMCASKAYDALECNWITLLIKDPFVSFSATLLVDSLTSWFSQWGGRSVSGPRSMWFPIFSLSVKNIPWFLGARWDKKWPPTTALSAVSLALSPPHPTWGPSTSVRMVCLDPPRTFCPHPTHTRCPRSMAKSTTAPRGKVSVMAPTQRASFSAFLSLQGKKVHRTTFINLKM